MMAGISVSKVSKGLATVALGTWMLSACDSGSPTLVSPEKVKNDARTITGVLTLYNEGESFRECGLQQPWNCGAQRKPECGFAATPESSRIIQAAIDKAGAHQGFATFGVVMTGVRAQQVGSGHLGAYDCEYRARSVAKAYEVPNTPPAK